MLVSSFNLLQSFNYTPYLFYKKTVQIRDQVFLYVGPVQSSNAQCCSGESWPEQRSGPSLTPGEDPRHLTSIQPHWVGSKSMLLDHRVHIEWR